MHLFYLYFITVLYNCFSLKCIAFFRSLQAKISVQNFATYFMLVMQAITFLHINAEK